MMMRKFAATAALLTAAIGITAGTADAAPAKAPNEKAAVATVATGVNYQARPSQNRNSALIHTDFGSLVNENGMFKIKAANGTVLAGLPLSMRVDQFEFPIEAAINGHDATLTPKLDVAHAVYKPIALPFEDQAPWKTPYDREVAAFTRLKDTVATGAAIGVLTGTIGGGVIGCGLGALVGTAVTGVLLALFGAGPLAGCLAGAAIGVPLGAIVGAILVTAPVAIGAGIQYLTTTNSPFERPKYPAK